MAQTSASWRRRRCIYITTKLIRYIAQEIMQSRAELDRPLQTRCMSMRSVVIDSRTSLMLYGSKYTPYAHFTLMISLVPLQNIHFKSYPLAMDCNEIQI